MKRLTSVLGNSQRLDGGAMFGNAPKAMWSRWSPPDDANRIELACRCLLVQEANRNILFETGIGAFFAAKLRDRYGVLSPRHELVDALRQQGLSPDDIDIIVLSHLHFDHAGGLLKEWQKDQAPQLAFPKANIVVGERAWNRACNPHPRDRASFIPALNNLLDESGKLEVVSGSTSASLGAEYRFHMSDGHTPGLLATEIAMPDGPVVFVADLIPGTPWVHVPITMGYDRHPELLIDEKTALLEDLFARGGRLFYTHDSTTAISRLHRDERGRFSAVDRQPAISGMTR